MSPLVTKEDLQLAQDNMALRLTVRMGGVIAVGVAILAAIIRL